MNKEQNRGLAYRLGKRYLNKRLSTLSPESNGIRILNKKERHRLKRIHQKIYLISGLIGALFVLLVILPFHLFPNFFQARPYQLFGFGFSFELYYSIYGLIMVLPEIWLLNVVNVRAVKEICELYEYPTPNQDHYENQIRLLTEAGLEIPDKHLQALKINPYIGLPKISYYALFLFAKLKAALSNVFLKLIFRRLLGRYALRLFMDLVGIPVYAFWDAWASHQVMREAQMRLISTASSKSFLSRFSPDELNSVKLKIPALVNYIAQKKRSYNFALYAFIHELTQYFPELNLRLERSIQVNEIFDLEDAENIILAQLMIFGFIVDGTLSLSEKVILNQLGREPWFPMQLKEIETILSQYVRGETAV